MPELDEALGIAVAEYVAKRPKTAAMHTRAKAVMPGGNTRTVLFSKPFPIRVESAEGCRLTDIDGHCYVDFVGEYSAGLYGHSHPRILAAVQEALAVGLNMGAQHEREVAFAEAVTQRFSLDQVRFTNSGTEANMMALAAARNYTQKPAIMPMHGGYHGGTLYFSHGASPVNAPFECVMGHFNDVAKTRELIVQNAQKLAAVILEPMLGGGGCIAATHDFLATCLQLGDYWQSDVDCLHFTEQMLASLSPSNFPKGIREIKDHVPDGITVFHGDKANMVVGYEVDLNLKDESRYEQTYSYYNQDSINTAMVVWLVRNKWIADNQIGSLIGS